MKQHLSILTSCLFLGAQIFILADEPPFQVPGTNVSNPTGTTTVTSQHQPFASWNEALASVTWGEWEQATPPARPQLPGGATARC